MPLNEKTTWRTHQHISSRILVLLVLGGLSLISFVPRLAASQAGSHYERQENKARVIVFVHGLFGNPIDTWTCPKGAYWPKLLLSDSAFNDSDIYVLGYATPTLGNRMNVDEIVGNIYNRMKQDEVFQHRDVVFVTHSLGGLVVQRFLLTRREYAPRVSFIYFFSTPQTGTDMANIASVLSSDPLLKEMSAAEDNDYLLNLESEWKAANFDKIRRYCAYETKPTKGLNVVGRLSATRNCDSTVAISQDHRGIVKPCNDQDDSYIAMRNAIQDDLPPVFGPVIS